MALTLLLDLDNTLLGNEMDTFVPAYLQSLSRCMAPHADPAFLVRTLLSATQKMVKAGQPDLTLAETFDTAFYPPLGVKRSDVQATIDRFYAEEFPRLKSLTQFRPEAVKLVEAALAHGYRVGIATNPLFPRTAIVQRLTWAGLSPSQYPFSLIPSYESFHFAKPHPAYYAEFLAQMGWPEGPVVMVGDDPANDITPAQQLGLPTFWINSSAPAPLGTTAHGTLADVLPWLDSTNPETLQPVYATPSSLLAIATATPAALATLAERLTPDGWTRRPLPDEWSVNEILCHLRDVEDGVNLPRMKKITQETNPFIPGEDTDRWAAERGYCEQNGIQAMRDFTASRKELLALLGSLPPEGWDRPARHAIFGPTRLHEIVNILTQHDRLHVRQVYQTIQSH